MLANIVYLYLDVMTRLSVGCVHESVQLTHNVELELLPDHARRSRHSSFFPFRVGSLGGNHITLACTSGSRMWD